MCYLNGRKSIIIKDNQHGLTLVELMITTVIFAILLTMIAQNIFGLNSQSIKIKINQDLRSLEGALNVYYKEVGEYPANQEGLVVLVDKSAILKGISQQRWQGPYIKPTLLYDPWDKPYRYEITDEGLKIYTLGADEEEGGVSFNKDIGIYHSF